MLQGKMKNIGCKLLLVLTLWTMSTEAIYKGAPTTKCHLSKYKFLESSNLETFKNVQDKYEDTMLLSDQKCKINIFHRNWEVSELPAQDRVILVKEELNLITDVLKKFGDPSLSKHLLRPLEILEYIKKDLKNCPHSQQPSEKLTSWLEKFQAANKTESLECLKTSVILNLFRVLNGDLRSTAYMNESS